ncbi:ACT domain-containing protein [Bifidobacterium asteroides]|uniref:ACT domain-containing protein n=1 Tax=Bifidobacterium asteroides TaxID=1684 RepID=UPI0019520DB3
MVCPADIVPSQTLERSDGWRAFRIQRILDFSLIGIMAPIATILADKGIGIFAVSTTTQTMSLPRPMTSLPPWMPSTSQDIQSSD